MKWLHQIKSCNADHCESTIFNSALLVDPLEHRSPRGPPRPRASAQFLSSTRSIIITTHTHACSRSIGASVHLSLPLIHLVEEVCGITTSWCCTVEVHDRSPMSTGDAALRLEPADRVSLWSSSGTSRLSSKSFFFRTPAICYVTQRLNCCFLLHR